MKKNACWNQDIKEKNTYLKKNQDEREKLYNEYREKTVAKKVGRNQS